MEFLITILLILIYFMPTAIAYNRNSTSIGPILFVNLFLGWTLLFWIVALIWASSSQTRLDKEIKELQLKKLREE